MPYTVHPLPRLRTLFEAKPWQGADPMTAKYLFIGLDANYGSDIEQTLPELWDYLNDGQGFWRKTGVHHPFLLKHYKGDGRKYHDNFAKIGFGPSQADEVSFIELLHLPTTGRSSLIASDLDKGHLSRIRGILEKGDAKQVFLPRSVSKLMRESGVFPMIGSEAVRQEGALDVLAEGNGVTIYQMYHFSCYGWQTEKLKEQIEQIGQIAVSEK